MTPVTDPQGRGRTDALLNYLSSERDVVVGVCVWYRLFNVDSGNHGSLLPSRRPKSKPSAPMSSCWFHLTARGMSGIPLEQDDRNGSLGPCLVAAPERVVGDHSRPEVSSLVAGDLRRPHGDTLAADLDVGVRVGSEVLHPRRVLGMPA